MLRLFPIFWNSLTFFEEEKNIFTDRPTLLFLTGSGKGNKDIFKNGHRELILVFVTEALTYMIIPAKTKIHRAWKKDIMLCVCI